MNKEMIYPFGLEDGSQNGEVGHEELGKEVLGGKGYALRSMSELGVPVPPGFTIPTYCYADYKANPAAFMANLDESLSQAYAELLAHDDSPMLVSVRSGARVSCPGMMDTILNVGITSKNIGTFRESLGDWTAEDCHRRLITMYGEVVAEVSPAEFDNETSNWLATCEVESVSDLSANQLQLLNEQLHQVYAYHTGVDFPDNVEDQLKGAISAVFESWDNERAVAYREYHGIPHDWGTAVTVQKMVFGNRDENSCTGVVFSRNPSTGAGFLTGEFLVAAQGEDVVDGSVTPNPIGEMANWNPELYAELAKIADKLEATYKDMQDIEFTVDSGELYILQTRDGKRTTEAALRIAEEMYPSLGEAVLRKVDWQAVLKSDAATLHVNVKDHPHYVEGISASNGAVTGYVAKTTADADMLLACDKVPVLVAEETTPDDLPLMIKCAAFVTEKGGATSHAAVVARSMNKVCVTNIQGVSEVLSTSPITVDGSTGRVWMEELPVKKINVIKAVTELFEYVLGETERLLVTTGRAYTPANGKKASVVIRQDDWPDNEALQECIKLHRGMNRIVYVLPHTKAGKTSETAYLTLGLGVLDETLKINQKENEKKFADDAGVVFLNSSDTILIDTVEKAIPYIGEATGYEGWVSQLFGSPEAFLALREMIDPEKLKKTGKEDWSKYVDIYDLINHYSK